MKKLRAVVQKFCWSLRRRGLTGTLALGLRRLGPVSKTRRLAKSQIHPFDLKFGVNTSGLMDGTDLFTGHEHDAFSTAYWGVSPSRWSEVLRRWIDTLPPGQVEDYTFVDIGCGKGRMLLIASELPFRQVIGVELNGELASIAAKNAEVWRETHLATAPIHVIHQDATKIARPAGNCLFFLYNPFGPEVLRKLLAHLDDDDLKESGALDLVYLMPEFDQVLAEREGYRVLWKANITQTEETGQQDDFEDVLANGAQPCCAYRRSPS
jgi:SAM-dependent methyltransferase